MVSMRRLTDFQENMKFTIGVHCFDAENQEVIVGMLYNIGRVM